MQSEEIDPLIKQYRISTLFRSLGTLNFYAYQININHFFICPNSKSQQSAVRKLRLTLPEGVIRISLARMLEYVKKLGGSFSLRLNKIINPIK